MNDQDREKVEKMIKDATITKQEIKEDIIKPLLATVNAYHEGDLKLINADLKRILRQTTRHNQRMTKIESKNEKHEQRIELIEKADIANEGKCPNDDKVRALEDAQLTQKSIRKWIIGSVGIASGAMTIIWILFQFVADKI